MSTQFPSINAPFEQLVEFVRKAIPRMDEDLGKKAQAALDAKDWDAVQEVLDEQTRRAKARADNIGKT